MRDVPESPPLHDIPVDTDQVNVGRQDHHDNRPHGEGRPNLPLQG